MKNKNILVYDLMTLPKELTADEVFNIYKKENIILYNGGNIALYGKATSNKPYFLEMDDSARFMVDISTDEGKIIMERILKERDSK